MAEQFPNPMGVDGFEFVEFASPDPEALADMFVKLGFTHAAKMGLKPLIDLNSLDRAGQGVRNEVDLYLLQGAEARFGNGDKIRLVRLEESEEGGEQRRIAEPTAKLVRPDSCQLQEPLRAPFVGERSGKRGKSRRSGVVWRLVGHGVGCGRMGREVIWRGS